MLSEQGMELDLQRFYKVCNPSYTLAVANPEDKKYYIEFSSVRGGTIVEQLERTISRLSPDEPTCQLFTGHIGCGKARTAGLIDAVFKYFKPIDAV